MKTQRGPLTAYFLIIYLHTLREKQLTITKYLSYLATKMDNDWVDDIV